MGFLSFLKTLVIPALISTILYLFISFLVLPIWKRHRGRYSSYLPLDRLSTTTNPYLQRFQSLRATLIAWIMPSSFFAMRGSNEELLIRPNTYSLDFDEEDGEELFEVEDGRREALSLDAGRGRDLDGRRLSRDLEEGFKDDSDEDDVLPDIRNGTSLSR